MTEQVQIEALPKEEVQIIPISSIIPSKLNARAVSETDPGIQELSESISDIGLIEPIIVRTLQEGQYEVVAGHRRLMATKVAGIDTIRAIVRCHMSDLEAIDTMMAENCARKNLTGVQIGQKAVFRIAEHKKEHTDEPSIAGLARCWGLNRPELSNYIKMCKLPKMVQELNINRDLSDGHCAALLPLIGNVDDSKIKAVAEKAKEDRMTVMALRELVDKLIEKTKKPKKDKLQLSSDEQELFDKICDSLNLKGNVIDVKVKETAKGPILQLSIVEGDGDGTTKHLFRRFAESLNISYDDDTKLTDAETKAEAKAEAEAFLKELFPTTSPNHSIGINNQDTNEIPEKYKVKKANTVKGDKVEDKANEVAATAVETEIKGPNETNKPDLLIYCGEKFVSLDIVESVVRALRNSKAVCTGHNFMTDGVYIYDYSYDNAKYTVLCYEKHFDIRKAFLTVYEGENKKSIIKFDADEGKPVILGGKS